MTGGAATWALARLALVRVTRGKALYIAAALIALPIIVVSVQVGLGEETDEMWRAAFEMTLWILPVVPSILVAPSLADELEDKTSAYLWSRPLPRWSIVTGKLLGLAPVAALIMATGLAACWIIAGGPSAIPAGTAARSIAAVAAAALVASMVVAAIATLVPRHAVATSVVYLLFVDAFVGALPLKFQYISVAFGARAIAGYTFAAASVAAGVLTLVAISTVTVLIAVRRIATLE